MTEGQPILAGFFRVGGGKLQRNGGNPFFMAGVIAQRTRKISGRNGFEFISKFG
jgi:hypothetical protein